MKKLLDDNGLLYLLQSLIGTATPSANGTGSAGISKKWSREDHVHPSDSTKVDKVQGKGLSENDFTTTLKNKLDGIAAGAEANVNADWNASSGDAEILNKPSIPSSAADVGAIATTEKGAASGVATLDSSGKVPSSQLPSYVDDVIEAYPISGATELSGGWLSLTDGGSALTPESGKIYIILAASTSYAANTEFRWGGTTYAVLSSGGDSALTNAEIADIIASA